MSSDERDVDNFITLFRGRADAYGSWEGGCIREPLTRTTFQRHLDAGPYIGVYCSVPVNGVAHTVWGCTDIDYDDYEEAARLQSTFDAVGVAAWTEKTRKGWHIWVFMEQLTPSADVRRMFLAAHQVAQSKPKEVNPKQSDLNGGKGLGNYVRLPYPGGLDERRCVNAEGVQLTLEEFTSAAVAQRATAERVAELAGYYIEPTPTVRAVEAPTGNMAEAARMLTPLGRVIFRDGPIVGRDRSTTITHLAHECAKAGISVGDALMILEDADLRWGKYLIRGAAGEMELVKLVERAYGVSLPTS